MFRLTPVIMLAAGIGVGCKDEPGSWEVEKPPVMSEKANVVSTPVPYGKKIPCATLLDVPGLASRLGKDVMLSDQSQSDVEATSVCQVKLAGTPPSAKDQERMWIKNNRVLGVMPGDEICQITAYCSFLFEPTEEKKKCESRGELVSSEPGILMCTKVIEAGENYRYVISVLDPDTKCKVVVNPGPSVIDEATVKQCAKAAMELITVSSIGGKADTK